MPGVKQRFYALMTKSNSERMAADDLRRIGYSGVYAPLLTKVVPSRRNKARKIETLHPFFRGYVFVALEQEGASALFPRGWHAAERAKGALRFVRFGGEVGPSPLPIGFVEAFADAMDPRGIIHAPNAEAAVDPLRARMEAGRKIDLLIKDGPFASFNGYIEPRDPFDPSKGKEIVEALAKLDTRGRIHILVSVFGRISPVELERDQVELLESDRSAQTSRPFIPTPRLFARRA